MKFAGTQFDYAIDKASNRLMSTTGPAPALNNRYDAAGNLIDDGTFNYTYNDLGKLATPASNVALATHRCNGLGQQVQKIGQSAQVSKVTTYVYNERGQLLGNMTAMVR